MTSPHETRARDREASAIASHLRQYMPDPGDGRTLAEVVAEMSDQRRRLAAAAAGQRPPDDETWTRVVRELEPQDDTGGDHELRLAGCDDPRTTDPDQLFVAVETWQDPTGGIHEYRTPPTLCEGLSEADVLPYLDDDHIEVRVAASALLDEIESRD